MKKVLFGELLLLLSFLVVCSVSAEGLEKFNILGKEPEVPSGCVIDNIALASNGAKASADAPFKYQGKDLPSSYPPGKAIDGRKKERESRWISSNEEGPHWLIVDFGEEKTFFQINICPDPDYHIEEYQLQYDVDGKWKDIKYLETAEEDIFLHRFTPLKSSRVRFFVEKGAEDKYTRIFELEVIGFRKKNKENTRSLTPVEGFKLHYLTGKSLDLSNKEWKVKEGDDITWSKPEYNDRDWKKVEVNKSLFVQGYKGGFYWYRVKFDIPAYLKGETLLIDLGKISFYDQVFINGKEIGTFGTHPPEAPILGSSGVHRKYPFDSAILNFNRENVLAIRIYTGYAGGLYEGPYKISEVLNEFNITFYLKGEGKDSPLHYISDAEHLNIYIDDNPMIISPKIIKIAKGVSRKNDRYSLSIEVLDENANIIFKDNKNFEADYLKWAEIEPLHFKIPQNGNYKCVLSILQGDTPALKKEICFSKRSRKIFTVNVDKSLNEEKINIDRKRKVYQEAMGHFGPRFNEDLKLVDNLDAGDARGSLSFSSLVANDENFPLVFLSNLRLSPRELFPPTHFLKAGGYNYDGILDRWVLGYISLKKDLEKINMEVIKTNWAEKKYKYIYDDKTYMEFSQNTLSPAYCLKTSSNEVRVFDKIENWGIGLPSKIAFVSGKGIKIVNSAEGIDGEQLKANWILVWFNGSTGWNEFDIPWLFVMEKKPREIKKDKEALFFEYKREAGYLFGMPLFGARILSLYETDLWKDILPEDIVKKCNFWSRALLAYPIDVERFFNVDFAQDSLLVQDKFKYMSIEDEWGTKGLEIAPVPPALLLTSAYGTIPITFNKQIFDCDLTTLHGPYTAVIDSNEVKFEIKGLLHYAGEVRKVIPADDTKIGEIKKRITELAEDYYNAEKLELHPWNLCFLRGSFVVGMLQQKLTNMMLALPYMNDNIKNKCEREIRKEVETYFLWKDKAEEHFVDKIKLSERDKPLLTTVYNPLNKLELTMFTSTASGYAIDGPCWESLRLHSLWHYAYYFNRWEFIEKNWEYIKTFFNFIPNSHDWAICASWDTYSGLRVGNGLQESGIMHAGACAIVRMANKLGDKELVDYASYFACMQLVAMDAAVSSIDYFREARPWLSSHSEAVEIEEVETALKYRYVEFNEHAGFSQNVIFGLRLSTDPGSYIMTPLPEIMRPYKEIWPKETEYFFTQKAQIPSLDHYLYMLPKVSKDLIETVLEERGKTKRTAIEEITDLRAYVDFLGKIKYENILNLSK